MPAQTISQLRQLTRTLTIDHELDKYGEEHRLAAVLILVYPGRHGLDIVLTRRSEHLPNHAGQISFPGGSIETDDPDPIHTALREANEEIALEISTVEVLGILDVILLPSGFAVAPVLAIMEEEPALLPNPAEVEEIFSLPLSVAADIDQYGRDFLFRSGQKREFFFLEYQDYYIWGATAKMLHCLAHFLRQESQA